MNSIQLIRFLDVADLTTVSEERGVSPRSLRIIGEDFRSVESVLMNSLASPEFITVDKRTIIAEVPEVLRTSTITEVTVLSQNLTLTERSLVELTFGTRPSRVRGIRRLVQNFLRILLRPRGSNLFHKRSGGGLLRRVGNNITKQSAADVQVAVDLTKQYIISVQTPVREIPPTERLLNAEITSITPDPANTSLFVTILLTTHSGDRAGATLVT